MTAARTNTSKGARRDQQRALQREVELARTRARQAARRKNTVLVGGGIVLAVVAIVAAVSYALHGASKVSGAAVAADLGAPTSAMASPPTNGFSKVSAPTYRDGRPVLLFIGAQFCPHCAAERWAVVKALSQFGTFANLMSSSSSEGDIPTFDLTRASYTSRFVSFDHKDVEDRAYQPLQSLDATEQAAFNRYDSAGSIPLILVGGYAIVGDAYNLSDIQGMSFTSLQRTLQYGASSPIVTDINAETNAITAFLCHANGMRPGAVCGRPVIRSIVRTLH
jgi:hypothetical protein